MTSVISADQKVKAALKGLIIIIIITGIKYADVSDISMINLKR